MRIHTIIGLPPQARVRRYAVALLLLAAALPGLVAGATEAKKPVAQPDAAKYQTKRTQALSKQTYATLEAAQLLYDAKDFKGAIVKLDELKPRFEKLNSYEKAMYWNFIASIQVAMNDNKRAMESYKNVLRQPDLPDLLRGNTLYVIAQLSFADGNYKQAIKVMSNWMRQATEIKPEQHLLIAQARYQLKEYAEAEQATLAGLKLAKEKGIAPRESWLSLLRASYYELKNYLRAITVLETMVQRWPKTSYWQQLAGMYGLAEKPEEQLAVLRASYEAGGLRSEPDQLNLARLYLLKETPYPAVQLLKKGFEKKQIKESPITLQLYAQALSMAREHDEEIATLARLAQLSNEAKHYIYLGQAHVQLGHWNEAAEAYRTATRAQNVERPGALQMMLGNALYNQKKYVEARSAFQAALQYSDTVKDAATWVNFMDKEIQRLAALQAL